MRLHPKLIIRHRICASFLGLLLTACSSQAAQPTPDPFSSVAQQADAAFDHGAELFQQGRYVEAQNALTKARLLSPTDDPRIDDLLERTNAQLTPTATPAPPTPVPTASPTPIVQSSATPAADLADAYFGKVFVAVVPGPNATAVPMTEFSVDDQIGLFVEKLGERLHLPFTVRIFDRDSGALIANTPGDSAQRFLENFVWYHQGGETAGQYRLELYAGDVLTNTFDYVVGTVPVTIPTPVPTAASIPQSASAPPVPVPATPAPAAPAAAPAPPPPPPPPPVPTPQPAPPPPIVVPAPIPTPTPALPTATTISVAAGPSAIAAADGSEQVFVADRSGLVWTFTRGQPVLKRPLTVSGEPVGVAADATAGRIYVAIRDPATVAVLDAATGQSLTTFPLPSTPGDVLLDPSAGWLHVVLPDQDAIETIDVRADRVVRVTPGLHHVTGAALDTSTHTLYVSQLEGDLSILDALSGAISATVRLSDVGLSGAAFGNGQLYVINTPGRELIDLDQSTMTSNIIPLDIEPGAVAVGQNSGVVYLLASDTNTVARISPDGSILADIPLSDNSQNGSATLDPDHLWQRPRLALNSVDESVYVIEPDVATLAIAPPGS